ncbi:hypothetical protein AB0M50_54440, partial [Nonomuraea fuscirosea]|uniref:hypothetical protein n=1 Tax=Nonomuraea fuscirosea TaxID=1291556 RepID=UPI00341F954F
MAVRWRRTASSPIRSTETISTWAAPSKAWARLPASAKLPVHQPGDQRAHPEHHARDDEKQRHAGVVAA